MIKISRKCCGSTALVSERTRPPGVRVTRTRPARWTVLEAAFHQPARTPRAALIRTVCADFMFGRRARGGEVGNKFVFCVAVRIIGRQMAKMTEILLLPQIDRVGGDLGCEPMHMFSCPKLSSLCPAPLSSHTAISHTHTATSSTSPTLMFSMLCTVHRLWDCVVPSE